MTVYVDNARIPFGRMLMSHMMADTLDELHEMAVKLGLRRWFQDHPGSQHYDLSVSKREEAISRGAVAVSSREFVQLMVIDNREPPTELLHP
ncbi:hypothetical protein LCGC14_1207360 [marine sediment metagenome]|uniref:DUF4031 domain-containing protein n=1 Tax=marine sediment metagenome TaxID=412755 RepID=A0A0F9NXF1_9ZZZZ